MKIETPGVEGEGKSGSWKTWLPYLVLIVASVVAIVLLRGSGKESGSRPRDLPVTSSPGAVIETSAPTRDQALPKPVADPALFQRGYDVSRAVCQSCHLYPDPTVETKFSWATEILPRMALWLGFDEFQYEEEPGGERVREANLFPTEPAIGYSDWQAVCNFYVSAAPDRVLPREKEPKITIDLDRFKPRLIPFELSAMNLMVKIDEYSRRLFVGNSESNTLAMLGGDGKIIGTVPLPGPAVQLIPDEEGLHITVIGSLRPTDEVNGSLVYLERPRQGGGRMYEVRDLLHRPTETAFADFTGDGVDDFVVSEYGNFLGLFRWFERKEDGTTIPHVLLERPGAVSVRVHDFDDDGRPDIVAMMAQAREGIYLFMNQGEGEFAIQPVVEFHPSWGSARIELGDFDGDGRMDILAVNGDNGDRFHYPYTIKSYHGLRIYLNRGQGKFEEAWFHPLNGAYGAVVRDFDIDGDLDIAAIGYYLDFINAPAEGFVYFENQGNLEFTASTFPESIVGRWISIDAGDLDGDGDAEIVLGAYNEGPGYVPPRIAEEWGRNEVSIVVLENLTKSPPPARE